LYGLYRHVSPAHRIEKKLYNILMEPTQDEALLTAYLDGELTPQDRQLLEQRLADEPELRQHLTVLEETWHYLDLLDRESTDAEKIETTMRVTAVSMSVPSFLPPKISRLSEYALALIVGIAAFAVMFTLGKRSEFDDPSFRRMVKRLDMYHTISEDGGLEFLRLLAMERVFLPPLPEGTPPGKPNEYEPDFFSVWVPSAFVDPAILCRDEYSDAEFYQLFHKNIQTYRLLSRETAELIRQLHRSIEGAPRSVELVLTLQNYYYWRKSLPSYEREVLKKIETFKEKAAYVTELKNRLAPLLPEDIMPMPSEIIGIEESKHLAEMLAELPPVYQELLMGGEPIQMINGFKKWSRIINTLKQPY